ncbi:alpha/beta hydrolase [Catenulispora sp. NL8]|uniref:Alpha/beta hydrolase n=1 Tax=Catenulispora pinistramenti TaxID=2705254 RepID=A0ABS5L6S3_9ACTN|nr:alpha/beta hydrolase [Catenulispora pinistramenti]MBS2554045.1 alpha/beta hydrolase [Catenulispora pinistramenti]
MATFVLVPGFWLGAWEWDTVAERLRAAGHEVHPLTMLGIGERAKEATPETTLQDEVADIVGYLRQHRLSDVVLVGHSGGNMPVTGVADAAPELITRLVYVDTGPMPSGQGTIEFNPPAAQEAQRQLVADEGAGWLLPVPSFDTAADPVNLAGISEADLERMRTLGSPQPFRTVTDPLERPGDKLPVPASGICCTFTPEQITELAAVSPIFGLMTQLELHHLPTGHWPMLSRPDDLAALLGEIVK